ncbi:hypothetical protein [Tabrizicola sp. BL-A-41-H6]|uniref:hypothetical protein n=1 Tax=Tabrizicola sp. BL-A-41-H6 TaxID=3421107 RepID=UPI003D667106
MTTHIEDMLMEIYDQIRPYTDDELAELYADCEPEIELLDHFDSDDTFGDGLPNGFAPMIRGSAGIDDEIPF